ncbi:unnamed protein product [Rotaria sp. Silwood1]|nr:unnamed protein product [Rotaria sp. Silwood1]CAF1614208.1 unnamed protein product [Rotaria sp. Silwood1]CAF3657042.1 unnamed protein product [Rotaria sp. Silwood1]CAF3661364.1 unnamed protein product [Rotaria sp. Silwood1]CAF3690443.1 unnamed protein product [Rotaria sp. Silwood1]
MGKLGETTKSMPCFRLHFFKAILTCIYFVAGYDYRADALLSSLLGKSIQHVHRYAAFMQTMKFGFDICIEYIDRYKQFPSSGSIDETFIERIESIFHELFCEQANVDKVIIDQVVLRPIDLVSGLVQQMKILMDDTNAPIWSENQARPMDVLPINNI